MNQTTHAWRGSLAAATILLLAPAIPSARAMDALLLQDTYVDNTTSGKPAPNVTNYGSNANLRVTKNGTQVCRSFVKFSLGTLPPGITASNVTQARLRIWVNNSTVTLGPITLTPITSAWDELTITNSTSSTMTFGLPKVSGLPVNSSSDFISIDITALVKAWVSGALVNEGFVIDTATGTTSLNLYFDSKESTLTSHEPRLEIQLDSVGPQGPQGANGATGPQGPVGATGAQGPTGSIGPAGATGAQGLAGTTGPAGPVGATGVKGLNWKGTWSNSTAYIVNDAVFLSGSAYVALQANTNIQPPASTAWSLLAQKGDAGSQGVTGAIGPAGPQGLAGAQGATGVQGLVGATGQTGPAGAQGLVGPTGANGATGLVGPKGLNWIGEWNSSTAYNVNDAVSLSGSAYIALQVNTNTQPPAAGIWSLLSQKGDAGPVGTQGAPGLQGPAGATGLAGAQGAIGPQGAPGLTGDPGPAGVAGPQGLQGPTGPAGVTPTHIQPQGDLSMGEFTQGTTP